MVNERAESLLLDAKYQYREEQVRKIVEGVEITAETKETTDARRLLEKALTTAPMFFPSTLRKFGLSQEEFFGIIKPAILAEARLGKTLNILISLKSACLSGNHDFREVPVDVTDKIIPKPYQILYLHHMEELEDIAAESCIQAVADVLKRIEGNVPLIRYRRDLAEKFLRLEPAFASSKLASLPTSIPNVDLRYVYPKNQEFPILSLVVKPF